MRIAICDDSEIDRDIMSGLLDVYLTDNEVEAEMVEYESGRNLLFDVEDGSYFDLIFLDIFMAQVHGLDIARSLRDHGYGGKIVFLTSSPDFAVESYEVEAAGYLLKPHDFRKISKLLDRLLKFPEKGVLQLKRRNTVYSVPYNEIAYVESFNNVCILHKSDGSHFTVYRRLSELEKQLDDGCFLRCHQSYIVNMSFVVQADDSFELRTGDKVLIRQRNRKEIRRIYLEYVEKHSTSGRLLREHP